MAHNEFPKFIEINTYKLAEDTAPLATTMHIEYLSVNQPVDETLFKD
ncbi:MAG: hypothetical protein ACRCYY_15350 [Trueperaceae bacterium]